MDALHDLEECAAWQRERGVKCDIVLLNLGQVLLRGEHLGSEIERLTHPDQYRRVVLATVSRTQETIATPDRAPLWWAATTPTAPSSAEVFGKCPPAGWRFPPVIERYNQAAKLALRDRPDIGYLDLYSVAEVLEELSYDGDNYWDPVAREMANLTLSALGVHV